MRLFLCSAGSEPALAAELARAGAEARDVAPGVVGIDRDDLVLDPVFARQALPEVRVVEAGSVRALAEGIFAAFEGAIDGWTGPFAVHALTHAEPPPGLASRTELAAREALALLGARRRRASRRQGTLDEAAAELDERWLLVQILALRRERFAVSAAPPRPLPAGGLDLARWPGGDAPVAIDRTPPSRAYQKLEEAFAWMGAEPRAGETCVDLGAAPGGWTATALKRRARVVAVDRAPLARPFSQNPHVASVIGNAFTYLPAAPVDWLLCDVVCEPARSLAICDAWLSRGLCRNLVVTVKFKGRAGYGVLDELPVLFERVRPAFARTKQLAHNKNEVTVMVRKAAAETAAAK
ncbi:MAG TPA: SAM-dependent methyltransferase [Polyangia bacterium]